MIPQSARPCWCCGAPGSECACCDLACECRIRFGDVCCQHKADELTTELLPRVAREPTP